MSREAHVRFCERAVVRFRRATRLVVFGERHLRHLLNSYQKYYNEARTHLSLHKDAPIPRAVQTIGRTLAVPVLGGLHHQYFRAYVSDRDRLALRG
jgi:hypothetical protein